MRVARQRLGTRRNHIDIDHVRNRDGHLADDVVEADAVETSEVELTATRERGAFAEQQPRPFVEPDLLQPCAEINNASAQ